MSRKGQGAPTAIEALDAFEKDLMAQEPRFGAAVRLHEEAQAFNRHVASELVKARRRLGWDQSELAERLDYSQSTISRLESGRVEISVPLLHRLASVMRLPLVFSLGEADLGAVVTDGERETFIAEVNHIVTDVHQALDEVRVEAIRRLRAQSEGA